MSPPRTLGGEDALRGAVQLQIDSGFQICSASARASEPWVVPAGAASRLRSDRACRPSEDVAARCRSSW